MCKGFDNKLSVSRWNSSAHISTLLAAGTEHDSAHFRCALSGRTARVRPLAPCLPRTDTHTHTHLYTLQQ